MFTFDQLQMLDALHRHGSVTGAARALNFTQPAASRLIARLQAACGVELVRRAGRGVELTEAGLLLAEHARAVVDRLSAAEADVLRLRADAVPRVRVAALSTLLTSLVPTALALLPGDQRDLVVVRHAPDTHAAIAAVAAGDLDLAVVWIDEDNGAATEGLRTRLLLVEDWSVALPIGHRLAGAATIAMEDLADEPWIVGAQSGRERVLDRAAASVGFTPRIVSAHDDQMVLQGLVAAGVGVALLPATTLAVLHPAVALRPLAPAPPRRFVIAVHNDPSAVAGPRDALVAALEEASDPAPPAPLGLDRPAPGRR